jgi:hypothetical protein
MDYHISFPPPATATDVLSDLAGASGDAIRAEGEGVWRIGPGAILRADATEPQAAILRPGDDAALFTLLSLYFARCAGPDAGMLVVPLGTSAPLLVAITNDPGTEPVRTAAVVNVAASELLISRQVFATAWAGIVGAGNDIACPDETEEEAVVTGFREVGMLLLPFLADDPEMSRTTSFLVYGVSPAGLMRDILRVASYTQRDPGFLIHHLPGSWGVIEAVSFGTNEGPTIELRVPLPDRTAHDASAALAAAGRLQAVTVLFVTGIIDEEEAFIVRDILPDGGLGTPRRIKMQ